MDLELLLVHLDARAGEGGAERWGQLAGGTHQLAFIEEELLDCIDETNIERTIRRLHHHVVSFLHQTYWLRERAVWLAAYLCDDVTLADRLKARAARPDAFMQIARRQPAIIASLADLLQKLKRDAALRNIHTHESFVHLQIMLNGQLFDPIDVYTAELGKEADKQEKFGKMLMKAARKMSAEYVAKCEAIRAAADIYLEATDCVLNRSGRPHAPK